ncbi:hypothetical protein [Deinococcus maricopensis]|uniref:Uncharacterized protein n=1 Tax=Deinococcus maricopensis (strain DSM 21211 / LMG 22137 / NRRL B-23946 / LB-34) TaxID=709986 RepID=E8UAY0_DEIML|nr:hypothetical protein [Deinococcus maricopensis]ADV68219.1 hypothetical protein Deima_2586 [Deinococcus maricopensis DSM 21211]
MLDNILNTLKRGVDRARVRGEEVTQAARLRVEIYQLNRDLDGLYARLGRAYHGGADVATLTPIREEIARVDGEVAARERLLAELNARMPADDVTASGDADVTVITTAPVAARVWAEKQGADVAVGNAPAFVPTTSGGVNMTKDNEHVVRDIDTPATGDPVVDNSDHKMPPGPDRAGVALEEERERAFRQPNRLHEADVVSKNPDPSSHE